VHNLQVDKQSLEIQPDNVQNPAYISVIHVVEEGEGGTNVHIHMLVSTPKISGY